MDWHREPTGKFIACSFSVYKGMKRKHLLRSYRYRTAYCCSTLLYFTLLYFMHVSGSTEPLSHRTVMLARLSVQFHAFKLSVAYRAELRSK